LPSNRFVLVASALSLVGFGVFRVAAGDAVPLALSRGLEAGFSVLLSWALARELDPDNTMSAAVAGFAGFAIFATGPTNLGAVTALLFAVRLVAGTPGAQPTVFDLLWLPALAAYTSRATGGFVTGLALAAALAWTAENPSRGRQFVSAIVAGVFAVALAALRETLQPHPIIPTPTQWTVLGAAPISLAWLRIREPASVGDLSGEPLSQTRLVQARFLAVATGGLVVAWLGGAAAPALVGLWAALVGIAAARSVARAVGLRR
jgi:hypothetical protein